MPVFSLSPHCSSVVPPPAGIMSTPCLSLCFCERDTRSGVGNSVSQLTPFSCLTQVTHIKTIHQEDELIEIQSDTGTWYQRWGVRALSLGGQVMGIEW